MKASEQIDKEIADLADWRGQTLSEIRRIIHDADADVIEEWKWMGTATWSHDGLLCVANAHTKIVKMTFAQGAKLPDPDKLFNAGLEGSTRRAINFSEGDKIRARALKNLVRASVELNSAKAKNKAPAARKRPHV